MSGLDCSAEQPEDSGRGSRASVHFNLWQSPFVDGLDVVESSSHQANYPLHLHEAMEIIWVQNGRGVIECRGRRINLGVGDACVISPYEFHGGGAHASTFIKFCLIHVPQRLMPPGFQARYFRTQDGAATLPLKLIPRGCADRLLSNLVQSLISDRDLGGQMQTMAAALDALLDLETRYSSTSTFCPSRHPAIERVQSIIRNHYAEVLNVEALASEVKLNERYLISLFRSATGMPPHQFQIALRVDNARRLLPTVTPLSTIAASSGFADQSHLSRHFKRQYGFTPGAFRRMFTAY